MRLRFSPCAKWRGASDQSAFERQLRRRLARISIDFAWTAERHSSPTAPRGIGYCIAEALAEAGADVTIGDRDDAEMALARDRLATAGYAVDSVALDVTDSTQVARIADDLVARSSRIDVLINNAGIARSDTPAEAVSDERWLNVQRHRHRPQPQCYYNASKAAVHQLTKSLAAEWAPNGVRVNAVAPTYITTPLNAFADTDGEMYRRWIDGTPQARLGDPEEVAAVVLFWLRMRPA